MSVLLKATIGEIAAKRPQAAALFEILGIDYSCHGGMTLRDACAASGLDEVQVRRSLEQLPRDDGDTNWLEQPLIALTRHLGGDLHEAITEARVNVAARLSDDCERCEATHEQTARLRHEFAAIVQTLDLHFATERRVLFPLLEQLDDCWSRGVPPVRAGDHQIAADIQTLVIEHGLMIDSIEVLRAIADDLILTEGHCVEAIDSVRTFDHVIREHVHLANNVLFPRAVALESILSEAPHHPEVAKQ